MQDIEIFGRNGGTSATRHRKGNFVTINTKNRHTYLSRDARDLIFGKGSGKEGRLLIIHSKIERQWYFAKSGGDLFAEGFECVQNDAKKEDSVWRINGAFDTLKKMTAELSGNRQTERFVLTFDQNPKVYENMNLYRVILTTK